jgi:hypothetical protein
MLFVVRTLIQSLQQCEPRSPVKVKYQPDSDWDFFVDTRHRPIDSSLILPHYRARNQPIGHRMNMFVRSQAPTIQLKLVSLITVLPRSTPHPFKCRPCPRLNFYLEIQANSSNVFIWLPPDFKGHIHLPNSCSQNALFSPGCVNRIMQHVRINEEIYGDGGADEVVVTTSGKVSFMTWDIATGNPEKRMSDTWRRMSLLRCFRKSPQVPMNWDFLLDD